MKKTLLLLANLTIGLLYSFAQNTGINTNSPLASLDVNGDISLRFATINLANAANADVNTTANKKSAYRITGGSPLGYSISGFTGGVDGRIITIINASTSQMALENDGAGNASAPANRILTSDGNSLYIPANGAVTIMYDITAARWRVSNYSKPAPFVPDPLWYMDGSSNIYNLNNANVGIGNTNPQTKLDLTGDLRLRSVALNLPGGLNNDVDITSIKSSVYMFSGGALGGCQITGFTGGVDGRIITIFNNSTTAAIQLYDESNTTNPSAAANKILTGTGNSAIIYQNGSVTLRYDGAKQRWTVTGSNYTDGLGMGGSGGSGWGLAGNTGTNASNFIGTTDSKPFTIKTNNVAAVNVGTNGNVGIGTSSIGSGKLYISGSDEGVLLYGANGGFYGEVRNNVGDLSLEADANLVIKSAYGSPLINRPFKNIILNPEPITNLSSAGNVGIGNSTPANKLSVNGNADFSGNVGIGTTNPTYKLSVNGNIRAKEIVVESGWADYVFDENYKLPSLESVEYHIKQNKHLPGIPSADNILKEGLSIGAIQAKMMEKIEELTLYIIEMKKEIKLLKAKK